MPEGGIVAFEADVSSSFIGYSKWVLGTELSPLEQQQALFIVDPSLMPQGDFLNWVS